MKIYTVDFSQTEIAPSLIATGCPTVITAERGRHDRDFDVVHSSLTAAQEKAMLARAHKHMEERGIEPREDWPIGFELDSLPIGTVITIQVGIEIVDDGKTDA